MWGPLLSGVGIGAFAAAQVGPIWLLLVRTSARYGWRPGAAIGLAAALVDLSYAALGALGAAALLQLGILRVTLGVLGGLVLIYLGGRTVWEARTLRPQSIEAVVPLLPKRAFRTGLLATASNPLTILTWGAVFSGASAADVAGSPLAAIVFVCAIGVGSLLLHMGLATVAAAFGSRIGATALRWVDLVSGSGLVAFGLFLIVQTNSG